MANIPITLDFSQTITNLNSVITKIGGISEVLASIQKLADKGINLNATLTTNGIEAQIQEV